MTFSRTLFLHILVVTLACVCISLLTQNYAQFSQYFNYRVKTQICANHLFSESELQRYNGQFNEELYLAILGHVYDVSKGAKHYGPGEAYHMFVGHDASRAFITGEFEQYNDSLSDVSALTDDELQQLFTWKEFYDKTYPYLGKIRGRYFDDGGRETAYLHDVRARATKSVQATRDGPKYPSCNVEWKVQHGTRVWCTNRSGTGRDRQWVGRPRKVLPAAGSDEKRAVQFCACLPEDVTDALYVTFPNCDEHADSCTIPDH
ncbi:neuferricin homolog isoform X1 [Anopheles cruzii]|uniref:neuferricin homolog isoform X1 n=1 Tax=Anopheles cruzii TaxID=68878 RepID=UPI0022EC6319|nr:neuferricin homolog isoform X1 [Anopheles cruzii]